MGHRALVAYRRPDYLCDVRYSHWGGIDRALVDTLAAETPLAGGSIRPDLLAGAIPLERVLEDHLDPRVHETLYLVSPAFEVTTFVVCWLGWADGRDDGRGALVAVDSDERDREVRTWFRATKTALADVVEMGVLSIRAARSYLEARVCEDEDGRLYTYDPGAEGDERKRDGREGDFGE